MATHKKTAAKSASKSATKSAAKRNPAAAKSAKVKMPTPPEPLPWGTASKSAKKSAAKFKPTVRKLYDRLWTDKDGVAHYSKKPYAVITTLKDGTRKIKTPRDAATLSTSGEVCATIDATVRLFKEGGGWYVTFDPGEAFYRLLDVFDDELVRTDENGTRWDLSGQLSEASGWYECGAQSEKLTEAEAAKVRELFDIGDEDEA